MLDAFDRVFNWKKYPNSVFFLAIPLVGLAFALLLLRGILEIKENGDWGYLIITVFGIILLIVAVVPLYRTLKQLNKANEDEHG